MIIFPIGFLSDSYWIPVGFLSDSYWIPIGFLFGFLFEITGKASFWDEKNKFTHRSVHEEYPSCSGDVLALPKFISSAFLRSVGDAGVMCLSMRPFAATIVSATMQEGRKETRGL